VFRRRASSASEILPCLTNKIRIFCAMLINTIYLFFPYLSIFLFFFSFFYLTISINKGILSI
jgi:hypothetical protein